MVADTRDRVLEAARLTVQDLGYSGLSFRELAKDVGIKSASIHYYFATKGDLGAALASRYTAYYKRYLDDLLDQGVDPHVCMQRYTGMFADTLRNENRMCLAGILAAERNDLPEEVRAEVVKFGVMNTEWLAKVLLRIGNITPEDAEIRALAIFAAVSGAQLIAHSRGDVQVFEEIISGYRSALFIP